MKDPVLTEKRVAELEKDILLLEDRMDNAEKNMAEAYRILSDHLFEHPTPTAIPDQAQEGE